MANIGCGVGQRKMKKRLYTMLLLFIVVLSIAKSQKAESLSEFMDSQKIEQFVLIDVKRGDYTYLIFAGSDEYTALSILLVGNTGYARSEHDCITISIRDDVEDDKSLFLCDTANKKLYHLSGIEDMVWEDSDYKIRYIFSEFKILLEKN